MVDSNSSTSTITLSPLQRLFSVIVEDRRDLVVLITYTLLSGLLSLTVPLGAQALVNTIAAGMFLQPLIVLTLLVLLGLVFAGALKLIQITIIERLQQRIFAKISFQLIHHIPRIALSAFENRYAPELVNRFFDTITLQKTWAKLLMDVPSSVLQILIGMTLLGIYSPFLLGFDFFLIFSLVIITLLGLGGLGASLKESTQKYRVAQWLEDVGRCHIGFKMNGLHTFTEAAADRRVTQYLQARKSHFSVIFRQSFAHLAIQVFASASVLGIGGWLVINQQMTLGQLVAAELVVVIILSALDKLMSNLENYYDLLTSLSKIGYITDLPLERDDKRQNTFILNPAGASVRCHQVHFRFLSGKVVLNGLDLDISSGSRVSLVGKSGAGKSTLATLICGLNNVDQGLITINGMDIRDLNLTVLRKSVALVGNANDIFEGTIEENILMGRTEVPHQHLQWALEMVCFTEDLAQMPAGLQTSLISEGLNISLGQRLRLLMARAILERPQLLILDESFAGLDEQTKLQVVDNILNPEQPWTVLNISHDAEVVERTPLVYVMTGGQIVEAGSPESLAKPNPDGSQTHFSALFPELTRQLRLKRRDESGGRL